VKIFPPHLAPGADDRVYRTHAAFEEDRRRAALESLRKPLRRRSVITQFVLFGVVLALWRLPLINPIKLLVVLFHEMSHVIAAYATGGVVFGIAIDPGAAGMTLGMGGNETVILAAGYVGSVLIGAALYALCAVWGQTELLLLLCALCSLSLGFGWLNDFTAFFGYGALLLLFGALFLPENLKKFCVRLTATCCCLYPVLDVAGEVFSGQVDGFQVRGETIGSDALQLAAATGLSEVFLVVFWVVASAAAALFMILWSSSKDAATEVKRTFLRTRLQPARHRLYDPSDPSTVNELTIR
jgi:hypothetical protein